jgi:hypothetical protein
VRCSHSARTLPCAACTIGCLSLDSFFLRLHTPGAAAPPVAAHMAQRTPPHGTHTCHTGGPRAGQRSMWYAVVMAEATRYTRSGWVVALLFIWCAARGGSLFRAAQYRPSFLRAHTGSALARASSRACSARSAATCSGVLTLQLPSNLPGPRHLERSETGPTDDRVSAQPPLAGSKERGRGPARSPWLVTIRSATSGLTTPVRFGSRNWAQLARVAADTPQLSAA